LLLDILIGDSTVISTVLAEAGGMAILFSYSRNFERQADDLAFQMMRGAGIDANALGRLFGRLQKELGGKKADSKFSQAMDLLSSHPGFDERIAKAELAAAGYRYHPALSAQEWRLVQNYCGD